MREDEDKLCECTEIVFHPVVFFWFIFIFDNQFVYKDRFSMIKPFFTILFLLVFNDLQAQDPYLKWVLSIGSTSSAKSLSVATDATGNLYNTGYYGGSNTSFGGGVTPYFGLNDIFLLKLDSSGNYMWSKFLGGTNDDRSLCVAVDQTGNVYITGFFSGSMDINPGLTVNTVTSAGNSDVWILKLDANGNYLWGKTIGGTSEDRGVSITTDTYGNVYAAGYFSNTVDFDPGPGFASLSTANGSKDYFLLKLDSLGNFSWVKSFGGIGPVLVSSVVVVPSGAILSSGTFYNTIDFDPGSGTSNLVSNGGKDIFFLMLDSAGNFLWAKSAGGGSDDVCNSVSVDALGAIYSTGRFTGTADFDPGTGVVNLISTVPTVFTLKLDPAGNFLWANSFGGTPFPYNEGLAVRADPAGNAYFTGYFSGTADFDPGPGVLNLTAVGSEDVFIQKLNPSGSLEWAYAFGSSSLHRGVTITTDVNGNILTTGQYEGTIDFDPGPGVSNLSATSGDDMYILKLGQCTPVTAIAAPLGPTTFCAGGSVTLHATTAPGQTYQWLRNGVPIAGATDSNLVVTTAGKYRVVVSTSAVCSATSNQISVRIPCIPIGPNGNKMEQKESFLVYPNPTNGIFEIDPQEGEITVFNIFGQQILLNRYDEYTFDLSNHPDGIYVVQLNDGERVLTAKIVLKR